MVTYDTTTKRYYDENGKEIPLSKIIETVDKITLKTKKEMRKLAGSYVKKQINLPEFEIQMSQLLKQAHILANGIAKGGRLQMTTKDWSKVGNQLKKQYQFLNGFERKIKNGKLSDLQIISRAQLYASSVRTSFFQALQEEKAGENVKARRVLNAAESCSGCISEADKGFVPIDEMAEIGEFECGQFCKCELEFEV